MWFVKLLLSCVTITLFKLTIKQFPGFQNIKHGLRGPGKAVSAKRHIHLVLIN